MDGEYAWSEADEAPTACVDAAKLRVKLEALRHATLLLEDVVRVSRERRAQLEREHRRDVARLERLAAAAQSRLAGARAETSALLRQSRRLEQRADESAEREVAMNANALKARPRASYPPDMHEESALLARDDAVTVTKEGSLAVRGHFIWRVRYVVVSKGKVVVRRWKGGAVKTKINLYEDGVELKFRDDQSLIAITSSDKATVLDCRSTTERDEWLGALVSAQERAGIDRESNSFVLSEEDSDESMEAEASRGIEPDAGGQPSMEDDGDGYSDVLLALQHVRDSMLQCNLSMSAASDDLVLAPDSDHGERRRPVSSLQSVCDLIESVDHGGRVILLHAGVLASVGVGLEDVLRALGERQREIIPRLATQSASERKQLTGKFVRDMLFHPIYCKRPEVASEGVQEVIDRFFPHCRLRRFSDDVKHTPEHKPQVVSSLSPRPPIASSPSVQTANSQPAPPLVGDTRSPLKTGDSVPVPHKKMRHRSFPNLFSLAGLTKPSDAVADSAPAPFKVAQPREPASCASATGRSAASAAPTRSRPVHEDDDRAELTTPSELPPLEPLRSLLWKLSCVEVAEQLTLFHHHQLSGICLWDFLRSPREAARELTEHFNRLVAYLVWSVLVEETPKDRAEVIEAVISIAHAASQPPLLNFHLVMACVGCLGDMPLMRSRLPTTWKKVRAKHKALLAELRKLCDHSGGFDRLKRRQSEETSAPALSSTSSASMSRGSSFVPFIGVVGVALERLRTSNYFTSLEVLDLEKLERQYLALRVLETALVRPPPNCRPRESSATSIDSIDRADSINRDAADAVQGLMRFMDMAFAAPRLFNLRSQQILASEVAQLAPASSFGSRTASALFIPSTRSSWNTLAAASALPSSDRASVSSPHLSTGEDFGSSFLSFRLICDLLATIPDASERVDVALEALLADERQPPARFVRRFWLELRRDMATRSAAVLLQGLRECVATLLRDVLTFKVAELAQLSGLDEASGELARMVYVKLVRLVTQPVFSWILARVKLAMRAQDARARVAVERLRQLQPRGQVATARDLGSPSSPVDVLEQLVWGMEAAELTDDPVGRAMVMARDGFLGGHAASAVLLLRQLLDPLHLTQREAAAVDTLDRTVSQILAPARGEEP